MVKNVDIIKTYNAKSDKIYNGCIDLSNQDTIFGITMSCSKPVNNDLIDFYIYKINVGISREFDYNIIETFKINQKKFNIYHFGFFSLFYSFGIMFFYDKFLLVIRLGGYKIGSLFLYNLTTNMLTL